LELKNKQGKIVLIFVGYRVGKAATTGTFAVICESSQLFNKLVEQVYCPQSEF
jgi:hypothetical protein